MFNRPKFRAILELNELTYAQFAARADTTANTLRTVMKGYRPTSGVIERLLTAYHELDHHGLDALEDGA